MNILNRPHPFIFNKYSAIVPAVITVLVLVLLRPYEFATFAIKDLLLWSFGFGLTVGLIVYCSGRIVRLLFSSVIDDHWTVGRELLLIMSVLFTICMLVVIMLAWLNPTQHISDLFVLVVLRTLGISTLPVIIMILVEQNHYHKLRNKKAEMLTHELLAKHQSASSTPHNGHRKLSIVGENNKVALHLNADEILYVKSEGNYVEVFHSHGEKVVKELVRITLKEIESQLSGYDFVRCHNRYIVNLLHIRKVEGNARNLEIVLDDIEEKIPVSRSRTEELLHYFHK